MFFQLPKILGARAPPLPLPLLRAWVFLVHESKGTIVFKLLIRLVLYSQTPTTRKWNQQQPSSV